MKRLHELQSFLMKEVQPLLDEQCPGSSLHVDIVEDKFLASKEEKTFILRLLRGGYENGVPVSVIVMKLYASVDGFDVVIESDTIPAQRMKKYNTFLRAVALLVATKMRLAREKLSSITSFASSWISVHLLLQLGFEPTRIIGKKGELQMPAPQRWRDKEFLKQHLSEGKHATRPTKWALVKLVRKVTNRSQLRREMRHVLVQDILPRIVCEK